MANKKTGKALNISDEERKRRSERALQLKAEGKIGGQYGKLGGRPRKPRATEIAAEEARNNAEDLIQVFKDGIDPENPMKIRLASANSWFGIEQEEAKLKIQEEKLDFDIEKANRDDLVEYLKNALTEGPLADQIQRQFDAESTAEDITDAESVGFGNAASDGGSS